MTEVLKKKTLKKKTTKSKELVKKVDDKPKVEEKVDKPKVEEKVDKPKVETVMIELIGSNSYTVGSVSFIKNRPIPISDQKLIKKLGSNNSFFRVKKLKE